MTPSKIQAIATAAADAGSFQKQVEAFIAQARMLADGGLTLAEIGHLLLLFVEMCVQEAENLQDATGEEKKAAVMDGVSYLLSIVGPAIQLPWYLAPFRKLIGSWLTQLADGAIEAAVARMNAHATDPAAVPAK